MSLVGVLGLSVGLSDAAAQTRGLPPVEGGVVGGVNIGQLSLPAIPMDLFDVPGAQVRDGSRIGLLGGILAEVPATPNLAFTTGALVSARGATFTFSIPGAGTAKSELRMVYLDLPALVGLTVARSRHVRFQALAGGTVGVKLKASMHATFEGQAVDESISNDVSGLDLGITFGGRADVGDCLFIVQYTHGLTNIAKDNPIETVKHRGFSMMAGWRF